MLLMDHRWSIAEEAGSPFALGPVQQDLLKGQGDLCRKRLDKYHGGWPLCTTRNAEANPRAKEEGAPGNPVLMKTPRRKAPGFIISMVQSTRSQVTTGP